ncbi:MAG: hypothetical protein HYY93_07675, partial [Planctomycetes bacterium]|nr:hypothetical protein [Planctomycetota bacterium]
LKTLVRWNSRSCAREILGLVDDTAQCSEYDAARGKWTWTTIGAYAGKALASWGLDPRASRETVEPGPKEK